MISRLHKFLFLLLVTLISLNTWAMDQTLTKFPENIKLPPARVVESNNALLPYYPPELSFCEKMKACLSSTCQKLANFCSNRFARFPFGRNPLDRASMGIQDDSDSESLTLAPSAPRIATRRVSAQSSDASENQTAPSPGESISPVEPCRIPTNLPVDVSTLVDVPLTSPPPRYPRKALREPFQDLKATF